MNAAETKIVQALIHLRKARDLLVGVAPKAAARVRGALKSTDGARRHAARFPDSSIDPTKPGAAGCIDCRDLGVVINFGIVDPCTMCKRFGEGHEAKITAERLGAMILDAVANARDVMWPAGCPDDEWSSETIEEVALALGCIRPPEDQIQGEAP